MAGDLDIQTDAYVDHDKLYVILTNLDFETRNIRLDIDNRYPNPVQGVRVKHLYLNEAIQAPVLSDKTYTDQVSSVQLAPEATMILEYTFADPVTMDHVLDERKYYADISSVSMCVYTENDPN